MTTTNPSPYNLPAVPLSVCNDQHCLLTGLKIEHTLDGIRCGRCSGMFQLEAIHKLSSGSGSGSGSGCDSSGLTTLSPTGTD